jgi:hypothetical protein
LLSQIERLAEIALFGTLSETYRTCGRAGCHLQSGGPKRGSHLEISYRGEKGKTTGYYVPKEAEAATREGVAAWQELQSCLRELAEMNKERNLQQARELSRRVVFAARCLTPTDWPTWVYPTNAQDLARSITTCMDEVSKSKLSPGISRIVWASWEWFSLKPLSRWS